MSIMLPAQIMSKKKVPSPIVTLNIPTFFPLSISDHPPLVVTTLGEDFGPEVAELGVEDAVAAEAEVDDGAMDVGVEVDVDTALVELLTLCDDADSEVLVELGADDIGAEDTVTEVVADDAGCGVVDEAGREPELGPELELEPPAGTGTTTPPCTLPTDSDDVVPAAFDL